MFIYVMEDYDRRAMGAGVIDSDSMQLYIKKYGSIF